MGRVIRLDNLDLGLSNKPFSLSDQSWIRHNRSSQKRHDEGVVGLFRPPPNSPLPHPLLPFFPPLVLHLLLLLSNIEGPLCPSTLLAVGCDVLNHHLHILLMEMDQKSSNPWIYLQQLEYVLPKNQGVFVLSRLTVSFNSMPPKSKTGKNVTIETGGATKNGFLPNGDVKQVIKEHKVRSRAKHFPPGSLRMSYGLTAKDSST